MVADELSNMVSEDKEWEGGWGEWGGWAAKRRHCVWRKRGEVEHYDYYYFSGKSRRGFLENRLSLDPTHPETSFLHTWNELSTISRCIEIPSGTLRLGCKPNDPMISIRGLIAE